MSRDHRVRRVSVSTVLLVLALAWAVALIGLAAFGPVYAGESASGGSVRDGAPRETVAESGDSSLVEEDGVWTLLPASLPSLIVVAVWLRLRHARSRDHRGADPVVWTVIALLVGFSLISAASIGLFLMPAALLLALAAAFAPRLQAST